MAEKQAGGLSLRIGLTLSQLQSDFLAAEQTVKQGIAALNRQQNLVKLRMEADTAGLDVVVDKTRILEIQERSLTQLLEMQRDKLTLATKAYQEYANSKNANEVVAKKLETSMERERLAVVRLEAQLKSLSAQKVSIDTSQLQNKISQLDGKIKNVRLKAEIDVSQLKEAGNIFDAQKVHISAVTKELELQRQKLIQLRETMYQSAKNTGGDSFQTINIKTNVLEQMRQISLLETKLKSLQNNNINLQIRADSIKQAEQTISDNIARINAKIEHIKVKTDIDVSKLGTAASEFDKAKAHVQGLNRELDLQNQKLAEMRKALATSVGANGLNNVKTINLSTEIQKQIQAIDQLKAKINELNKIEPPKTNGLLSSYLNIKGDVTGKLNSMALAFSNLRGATSSADAAIMSVLGVIDSIPKPIAAATAALVGVPILFKSVENSILDMTKAAAASGDATYVMSRGMQMSVKDAATFSTNAKVAGAQVNDLAMAVKNVQRQVARGGEDSRAAEWLKRYGESAYDASGNLKDLNQMTFALSSALKRAQADGKGAEFVLNVFRNVSADAITAIEDWVSVNEQASKIVKAGLANPKLAHEVQGNLNALNVQSAQLGTSFANALLPAANEIVPRMTDRLGKMTSLIKDNKDVILAFGKDFAEVWGAVESTVDKVVDGVSVLAKYARENRVVRNTDTKAVVEKYKDDKTVQNAKDILEREIAAGGYSDEDTARLRARNDLYSKELKRTEQDLKSLLAERRKVFAEANKPIIDKYKYNDSIKTATDLLNKLTDEEKQAIEQTDSAFGSLQERAAALNLELQNIRKTAEQAKNEVKEFKSVAEDFSTAGQERRNLGEDEIDQLRQFRKYEENAADIMAKLKLNDYEYKKRNVQSWIQEQLPRDTEQSLEKYNAVMKEASAKSAQIEQERADKLAEIRASIETADKTALQNKLDNIEKERQAWLKAGMDEAEASELAQKKLSDYVTNAQKDLNSQLQSLYKTEFENRLDQIEKERQAWIDKCGDEVKATQKAEQEKVDAQRNAAMNVIRQQAKEYEAYQKGGLTGLQAYKMADLKRLGVNLDYLNMTLQQLQQFQQANQLAEKGLMPQFMTATDKAMYSEQWQQSYQQLAKEFDDKNYAIVDGIKTTMSEVLGGIPITLKLDDNSVLNLSPDGQRATMRDYEIDNKGRIQSLTETNFELPSIVSEVAQRFSEMPSIVKIASNSLNELPVFVQGITENFSSMKIPQFADMNQPVREVTVRLNDLNAVLGSFSLKGQNQSEEKRIPVNVNVTVQIQEAHAWDSEHIQELSDRVADKIQPEIISAIGGDSNSY